MARTTAETFRVIVDYELSLREMVRAANLLANPNVTAQNFPVDGEGQWECEIVLVCLNRSASTEEVLAELDEQDLRPATIEELLALGMAYSWKQLEFPIIALGSIWVYPRDGLSNVPSLESDDDGWRYVSILPYERTWDENYRFVAVAGKDRSIAPAETGTALQLSPANDRTYPVTVNYDLSFAEMVRAGRYDLTEVDVTGEHFPIDGEGQQEREIVIVHLDRRAFTDEVSSELARRGLRPATIEELLAFGAAYPDKQRELSIVALGSVCIGQPIRRNYVPCLWLDSAGRCLGLRRAELGGWYANYRFAAVVNPLA